MDTDLLGWEIECQGARAVIREDGRVESDDPGLLELLSRSLREPVTVFRRGTVIAAADQESNRSLELRPGDRRYVVARVRALAAEDPTVRITGVVWER